MTGTYFDGDDAEAMALWDYETRRARPWVPDGWHTSPEQLADEAKMLNERARNMAEANGGKHSNPPAPPSFMREL